MRWELNFVWSLRCGLRRAADPVHVAKVLQIGPMLAIQWVA